MFSVTVASAARGAARAVVGAGPQDHLRQLAVLRMRKQRVVDPVISYLATASPIR